MIVVSSSLPSARALLAVFCVLLVLPSSAIPLQTSVGNLVNSDDQVFAVSGSVVAESGSAASGAAGVTNRNTRSVNWVDAVYRMQSVSELLVGVAALKAVPFSPDGDIPSQYLPRGVRLRSSRYPSQVISLRHLLQHTSGLTDTRFNTFYTKSPTGVATLRSFVEGTMLQVSSGQYSYRSDLWAAVAPGLPSSYNPSGLGIALVALIIENVIAASPTMVTSTEKSFAQYVQEQILNQLQMASTVRLSITNGAFPTAALLTRSIPDHSAAGVPLTSRTMHPAYPSVVMYYTTVADMGRLMTGLFIDRNTALSNIGRDLILRNSVTLPSVTIAPSGYAKGIPVTGVASGMQIFSYAHVCGSNCLNTVSSMAFGHISVDAFGQSGLVCVRQGTSTTSTTCVAVAVAHNEGELSAEGRLLAVVKDTMQEYLSKVTIPSPTTANPQGSRGTNVPALTDNKDDERGSGWIVLIVVVGVLVVVFVIICFWCLSRKFMLFRPMPEERPRPMVPVIELPSYYDEDVESLRTGPPRSVPSFSSPRPSLHSVEYDTPSSIGGGTQYVAEPISRPTPYYPNGLKRSPPTASMSPYPQPNGGAPYAMTPSPKPFRYTGPRTRPTGGSQRMSSMGNTDPYGNPY